MLPRPSKNPPPFVLCHMVLVSFPFSLKSKDVAATVLYDGQAYISTWDCVLCRCSSTHPKCVTIFFWSVDGPPSRWCVVVSIFYAFLFCWRYWQCTKKPSPISVQHSLVLDHFLCSIPFCTIPICIWIAFFTFLLIFSFFFSLLHFMFFPL